MFYYLNNIGRICMMTGEDIGPWDQLYLAYPSSDPTLFEDQVCSISDNHTYEMYYESPDEADATMWYPIVHAC